MRRRRRAIALLVDFDGVLRRYDPEVGRAVETEHGLEPGSLLAAGTQWSRLLPAIIGAWTRRQWLESIAEASGAPMAAVLEWDAYRGYLDPVVLDLVRRVRAAGRPVALATNATDDLRDDLARFGLADAFDAVLSSAELGRHKPTKEFFAAACDAVQTTPELCLFIDDDDRNIRGARTFGLSAMRWSGPDDLTYIDAAIGLAGA